jgi:hypothetical protein
VGLREPVLWMFVGWPPWIWSQADGVPWWWLNVSWQDDCGKCSIQDRSELQFGTAVELELQDGAVTLGKDVISPYAGVVSMAGFGQLFTVQIKLVKNRILAFDE